MFANKLFNHQKKKKKKIIMEREVYSILTFPKRASSSLWP